MVTMELETLYIHLGSTKAGSTSLQHFLSENRRTLANTDPGFIYPLDSLPGKFSQGRLANSLKGKFSSDSAGIWRGVRDEVESSNLRNVIISSEFFRSIPPNTIFENLNLLGRASQIATGIYYVRPANEWILSHYNQRAKNTFALPGLREYINQYCERYSHGSSFVRFWNDWQKKSGNPPAVSPLPARGSLPWQE